MLKIVTFSPNSIQPKGQKDTLKDALVLVGVCEGF